MKKLLVAVCLFVGWPALASAQFSVNAGNFPTLSTGCVFVYNGTDVVCNIASVTLPISDGSALLMNASDNTKLIRFSGANITTGTTRVYTMPNANVDLSTTTANYVVATGSAGAGSISLRALVAADIPQIDGSKIIGTASLGTTYGGTALNTSASSGVVSINSGTWTINNVLTANRLLYAATSNTVTSSASLTFDGSTFTTLAISGTTGTFSSNVTLSGGGFNPSSDNTRTLGTSSARFNRAWLIGLNIGGNTDPGNDNAIIAGSLTMGAPIDVTFGSRSLRLGADGYANHIASTTGGIGLAFGSPAGYDWFGEATFDNVRMSLTAAGLLTVGNAHTQVNSGLATTHFSGATYYGFTLNETASTSSSGLISFNMATTQKGSITFNGTTGVTYSTTSDVRLKNDTGVATSVEVLRSLVIHDFEWKATNESDRGVFAQEAFAVKPRAVVVGTDVLLSDGTPRNPWGVDYSKFVPDLIVGWQQHESRLATLETHAGIVRQVDPKEKTRLDDAKKRTAVQKTEADENFARRDKREADQRATDAKQAEAKRVESIKAALAACLADNTTVTAQGGRPLNCTPDAESKVVAKLMADAEKAVADEAKKTVLAECTRKNVLIVKQGGRPLVCAAQ